MYIPCTVQQPAQVGAAGVLREQGQQCMGALQTHLLPSGAACSSAHRWQRSGPQLHGAVPVVLCLTW